MVGLSIDVFDSKLFIDCLGVFSSGFMFFSMDGDLAVICIELGVLKMIELIDAVEQLSDESGLGEFIVCMDFEMCSFLLIRSCCSVFSVSGSASII